MQTFDVFDTLLGRRYFSSDPIWHQLATEFNIPDFVRLRKAADANGRSFDQIYAYLITSGTLTDNQATLIANRELALEIDTSFPVQKNIDRVNHGDILISDMYLPAPAILQLVRSVGLSKQVTIYRSSGDKSTGSIWRRMQLCKPSLHLGDHPNSDFAQANNAAIPCELYTGTHFTSDESFMFSQGLPHVAILSREVRLRTNSGAAEIFSDTASSLNLPLLMIASELLHRKYGIRPIAFLGRDCQLLHMLFSEYYCTAYYVPFSRKVAYANRQSASAYLRSHAPVNAVFVDISSTGATWQHLSDIEMTALIYSDVSFYTANKPTLPPTFSYIASNSEIGPTNLMLEVFNCGDHGHLESVEEITDGMFKATFAVPELNTPVIDAIQAPIVTATALSGIYKDSIRTELAELSNTVLMQLFAYCTSNICSKTDMLAMLPAFVQKETSYLNQFTNVKDS